jgi:hypothetical protein
MRRTGFVLLFAVVSVLSSAGFALASNPDTGPGCGLGKLIWGDYHHQKSIAPQVMMATTNGTFGSGTFGISTGTSGCTNDGTIFAQHQAPLFAEINFDNLSQEMAQGQGEHLTSLATLMGVPAEHQAEFIALARERYVSLLESGETTPKALLTALYDVMARHPVLVKVSAR